MSNKKRKCCQCKEFAIAEDGVSVPSGFFCSISHALLYAKSKQDKQRAKQQAKAKQSRLKSEKVERKATRETKEKLKTAGEWIKEAQAAVNKYIRMRDYGRLCICCGSQMNWHKQGGAVDAGHYRSRGAAGHLRFNLLNIHAQSVKCNRFLSGNVVDYRINLIKKIGLPAVEKLECDNKPKKFTIDYLKRIKRIFNKRARHYAKLRGI